MTGETTPLLSGGNPQIAMGDGDGPVQAYIAGMPGWKSEVGAQLDAIISRALPDVHKAVKWNSPMYGVAGRGFFLSFHCYAKYIKLAFFQGARLQPLPPGESKSQNTRYLNIHEGEAVDADRLTDWVRQAAALPGFLDPTI